MTTETKTIEQCRIDLYDELDDAEQNASDSLEAIHSNKTFAYILAAIAKHGFSTYPLDESKPITAKDKKASEAMIEAIALACEYTSNMVEAERIQAEILIVDAEYSKSRNNAA